MPLPTSPTPPPRLSNSQILALVRTQAAAGRGPDQTRAALMARLAAEQDPAARFTLAEKINALPA